MGREKKSTEAISRDALRKSKSQFIQRKKAARNGTRPDNFKDRDANNANNSNSNGREDYPDIVMENEAFTKYYQDQNILPSEQDFNSFIDTLKSDLPTTFRFTGSRSHASDLKETMIQKFFNNPDHAFEFEGIKYDVPKPLPWYPNDLAWQFCISKRTLRKSPEIKAFHRFLVAETEVGNISRQEAVSMIPVLLLDIQPSHSVLDMCAAPGSKTAQIIEAIHGDDASNTPKDLAALNLPNGCVVANDANYQRALMLVHQTRRLQSPCLLITNHEAQFFPKIQTTNDKNEPAVLQFDRILCDVPCSGDGTFRKNPMIWKTWGYGQGNGLHLLQMRILMRATQLLKTGGRMVYSTCSFNPIENEAVVVEALRRCKGSLKIVDVSSSLSNLKRRPGLSTWKVYDKKGNVYNSLEEVPDALKTTVIDSMFPPTEAEAKEFGLEHCLRVYPHDQNTGGFFVVVLEKTGPIWACDEGVIEEEGDEKKRKLETEDGSNKRPRTEDQEPEESATTTVTEPEAQAEAEPATTDKKPTRRGWVGAQKSSEDPFFFLPESHPVIQSIATYFGFKPNFPLTQFLVRSEIESPNNLYFVSSSVSKLLSSPNIAKLRLIHTGVKTFGKNEQAFQSIKMEQTPTIEEPKEEGTAAATAKEKGLKFECAFRFYSDCLDIFASAVTKRIVTITRQDMIKCLTMPYPRISEFSEPAQTYLSESGSGGYVFRYVPTIDSNNPEQQDIQGGIEAFLANAKTEMWFPAWKAKVSMTILVNKAEKKSLYTRLTGRDLEADIAAYEAEMAEKKKNEEEAKNEEEEAQK